MTKLRTPAYQIRHDFGLPTPYQRLVEAQHIFKRTDSAFIKDLKTNVEQIINTLKQNKGVQVFKNDTTKFAVGRISFSWCNIDMNLNIFIASLPDMTNPNDMSFVNIPDDSIAGYQNIDVLPNFTPLSSLSPAYKLMSIFGYVSPELVKNYSNYEEDIIGTIKHELLHVLHYSKRPALNVNAGLSYEFATDLIQFYNIKEQDNYIFPTIEVLSKIKNKEMEMELITPEDIILIIAACIYYLDDSESLAWIESFHGNATGHILSNRFRNTKKQLLKDLDNIGTYKIYNFLYDFILTHRRKILQTVETDRFLKNYIDRYIKSCKQSYNPEQRLQDITSRKMSQILNSWEVKARKFLKKASSIYKQNVDELSYPAK